MDALKPFRTALMLLLLMTLLTGALYPALVTGIAQLLFPESANGSLIKHDNKVMGSKLIGQDFTTNNYFWGRPSETKPYPYNAANSSGSNYGPTNSDYLSSVHRRAQSLQKNDPQNQSLVPVDLVTSSGSGLDPEISPYAAMYQSHRIAEARKIPEKKIHALIIRFTKNRYWGLFGEPRVNVLELNLALDAI